MARYTQSLTLRATDGEYSEISAEAQARGLSISRYLILAGLEARRARILRDKQMAALAAADGAERAEGVAP